MSTAELSSGAGFLQGGGELGRLMRRKDWSATPIGAPHTWPQSLLTTVSLCLASDFPIDILWGPALTQIYNDGYRVICGDAHPRALGEAYDLTWASAWDEVGPSLERARRGETSFVENRRMFLTRNGYLEETFFTFSHSPIRDESGGVGGIFHPVTETTAAMISARRTLALRDLGASLIQAETEAEVAVRAVETLSRFPSDIPFVLIYADAGGDYQLAAACGGETPAAWAPQVLEDGRPWPIASRRVVELDDVAHLFGDPPCGPYPEPPGRAFVLPLQPPGAQRPAALVIAGASSRLPMTEDYRSFYDLLGVTLTGALASVRAREGERRRAEALAEIDRDKTAFFSNVSHEFRTPLTLMLGPLEEALAQPDLTGLARERIVAIHRNGLRLLRLVNTLLDFSRVEAGRDEARYEPLDLSALTADLASVFRSACDEAGLVLTVDRPPLGQSICVDREMWEKIVLNLVSNAFKFTFEGAIAVRLAREGDEAVLTVADTGVGIAEVELARVFDRFHRVEGFQGRSLEGSGIGLALVRELVRLHGGNVRVESAPGQGAAFTVRLPLAGRSGAVPPSTDRREPVADRADAYVQEARRWLPDAAPASLEDHAAPPANAKAVEGARILLADDNADMRDYVRRLLEVRYRVETASNGEDALARIEANPPDLVLSGVIMPRLDGFGLLKAIRARPRLASLPVILLSARAGEDSRVEGWNVGADDYLVKPFSARELISRVATNLQLARLRRRADDAVRASVALVEASTDVVYRMSPDWSEMRELSGAGFLADLTRPDAGWLMAYIPEADQPRVTAAIAQAVGSGHVFELEHRVLRADGGTGWTLSRAVPSRDAAGEIVEWFGSASDITARKAIEEKLRRGETQLRTMVAELQHRTRNLLTIVSAVAEQTAANSDSPADFERRFDHRLAALGRVQGLLSQEAAPEITLQELIELELAAHGVERAARLGGPKVVLPPDAVQLFALALHELTTNALKHGALGHGGALEVSWTHQASVLDVLWIESCGQAPTAEPKPGFGLQMIQWMLPHELDAETALTFTPDGLRCSIRIGLETRNAPSELA